MCIFLNGGRGISLKVCQECSDILKNKEGRKQGRKEGRKGGRKEGREGWREGRGEGAKRKPRLQSFPVE